MFISWQVFEGFKITLYSTIEVLRLLLQEGFDYVLNEKSCQDVLEEYFGYQCDLEDEQTICFSKSLAIIIMQLLSKGSLHP